jgi:hypothetical protein
MGNHHPLFAGTEIGRDLDVLGNAIKYGAPYSDRASNSNTRVLLERAQLVILRHGGGRPSLTLVDQCIETAEKLLGLCRQNEKTPAQIEHGVLG